MDAGVESEVKMKPEVETESFQTTLSPYKTCQAKQSAVMSFADMLG